VNDTIEHLLRDLAPQVLASMLRRFRDFASAEDAVQEALLAASQQWKRHGVPEKPRGWLITVASRRLTDQLRSESARRRRETLALSQEPEDTHVVPSPDEAEQSEREDTLTLFFGCCHPSLSTSSAIALTLRALGGLTTAEIARAFLVPEATMAQRISRAKQTIKSSGVPFGTPDDQARADRLDAVLHGLYLIFNEGYSSSSGSQVHRVELADEAIRLTRLLCAELPQNPEARGLLALMLLTDARRAARTSSLGALIPLEEQDRSLWDREKIREGTALIRSAFTQGAIGPYQIQAAVAAIHDDAERLEDTDWPQIAMMYRLLTQMTDNPMAALSHAIAVSMVQGPQVGLTMVEALDKDDRLRDHYRIAAVRGHLYERAGDRDSAIAHYLTAANRTVSTPERDYLMMRAAKLRES
jgi:RNA polymerase sigma factor (sigma-70 family)